VIYFGGNESCPLIMPKGKIRSWPLDLGMGKEGERSLSDYKRMPRVVCKTSEEED
jgi:hypothetical protein